MRSRRTAPPIGSTKPTCRWRSATPTAGSGSSTRPANTSSPLWPVRATHPRRRMRAVEQLANYEARHADDVAESEPERARELYESAIARLEHLLAVAETAERHNLLGGTYKRRAAAEAERRSGQGGAVARRPKTTARRIYSNCSARASIHTPR